MALRRFLLAIGALLLLGSACRAPGETWILAGQSNAAGYSLWYDAPVPLPTPSGLTARALKGWGEVGLAVDPLRAPGDPRRSPWPQFAAERLARGYARPHLVQTAEPGTCLAIGAYGQKARWDPEEGDLYARMLERAAAARRAGFPRPVAVLWHQGECEAALGLPAPVVRPLYRDALMRFADAVGADLGVPVVAALIVPSPDGAFAAVRAAVLDAAALHPGILVGPDAGLVAHEEDGVHLRDVVAMGVLWADAVEAAGF